MSTVSSKSPVRRAARSIASSPAVAGFRPAGVALAVAAAFALQPVQANPNAGTVAFGTGTVTNVGGNTFVHITANGGNTQHSVTNWTHLGVPSGTLTKITQPNAASTSINRVNGLPTQIFGTLESNGRVVLVNPAGITMGQGAFVDTAAFTASTLDMSFEDAVAGRLRFAGGNGTLTLDGATVVKHGDVFFIGSRVETRADAVVQNLNGSIVVAAGQKVELTGRGLEGIRMEVQAPENEVVNLGKLSGDAVGVFAGTLKHSGLVTAQAVSTEGGKVVLKAAGDALVSGGIVASAGDKGGSIDVLGERVGLLDGATLQASGRLGGGSVRVGGDYQGANANVQNAKRTYVDANARIEANAIESGDGGRVIVWSDEATRMYGRIEARGGAADGNGGFAEVSGKEYLDYGGLADLRAPKGALGTLLLDPEDITIVGSTSSNQNLIATGTPPNFQYSSTGGPSQLRDATLVGQLQFGNVVVTTAAPSGTGGQITVNADADVTWTNANDLTLRADKGITVHGRLNGTDANAVLKLDAQGGSIDIRSGATVVAGSIDLLAKTDVLIGTNQVTDVNSNPMFTTTTVDALKKLSITATTGNVSTGRSDGYSSVNLYGGGSATEGIVVDAAGNATFDYYTTLDSGQSQLKVDAGGSILGNGTFTSGGTVNGAITLTAGGSINFGSVQSGVSFSGQGLHGGAVIIDAGANVVGGDINSYGDYSSSSGVQAGNGGTVQVLAKTGIDIDSIQSWGGSWSGSAGGEAAGGTAGNVTLTSEANDVIVRYIDATGGSGYAAGTSTAPGVGRSGADVRITAKAGKVDVGQIYAEGGYGWLGTTGGKGGNVYLDAAQDLVLRPYFVSVSALGGDSEDGAGGAGGRVEMKMGGAIQVIPESRESVDGFAVTEEPLPPFGTAIIGVVGGQGGAAASGGTGGNGGVIRVERVGGGSLVADTTLMLLAAGGNGGNAEAATGTAGAGGNGGNIELLSSPATAGGTPGAVVLRGLYMSAAGGAGGQNFDGTAQGPTGALGGFTAFGSSVEVEGDLFMDSVWTNKSVVNVRGASLVYGPGIFRNESDLGLYDTAGVLTTAVENSGRFRSFGSDTEATLTSNTGLVEVVAGSTLRAPAFFSNAGTVQVGGTIDIGGSTHSAPVPPPPPPPPPVEECSLCVLQVTSGTFVNEASGTLTGTGNIIVNGGSGTIDNFGTISPGGTGTVGTLTLSSSLIMEAGSTVATDLLSTASHDSLVVSGTARTGGNYAVTYQPGATFSAGDVFSMLQAGALDATTLPTVSAGELSPSTRGSEFVLVANAPFPAVPAPPPPPPPAPAAPEVEQVNNQVITFAQLFLQEALMQQEKEARENQIGKDDIVVTDVACTPR